MCVLKWGNHSTTTDFDSPSTFLSLYFCLRGVVGFNKVCEGMRRCKAKRGTKYER